jgi:spermidine synthase
MASQWNTLATVTTAEGPLELRQRGERDFLIVIGGRVLMTSSAHRSEDALARLAAARLSGRAGTHVLIGGLGMGYTLRAALAAFPVDVHITVAELTSDIVEWCLGPLAVLTDSAAADPRAEFVIDNVAAVIARASASYDAILLDLYEGPNAATQRKDDPFYGAAALAKSREALRPGGVLAVWSEDPDAAFARRFASAGFSVTTQRPTQGGRTHVVYLGIRG